MAYKRSDLFLSDLFQSIPQPRFLISKTDMSATKYHGESMETTEAIRDMYRDIYQATLESRKHKILPTTDDDHTERATFYFLVLAIIIGGSLLIFFYNYFCRDEHDIMPRHSPLRSPVKKSQNDPSIFLRLSQSRRSPRRYSIPMLEDAECDRLPAYADTQEEEVETSSGTIPRRIAAAITGALHLAIQVAYSFVRNVVTYAARRVAGATSRWVHGRTYGWALHSEIVLPSRLTRAWAEIRPFATLTTCLIGLLYFLQPILPGLPAFRFHRTPTTSQWREVPQYSWYAWLRGEEAPSRRVVDFEGTTRVIDYYGTRTITSSGLQPSSIPHASSAVLTSVAGFPALQLPKQVAPWIPWTRYVPQTAASSNDELPTEARTVIVTETQAQDASTLVPTETATFWSIITVTHNHTQLSLATTIVTETRKETATVTIKQHPFRKRIHAGNNGGQIVRYSHGDLLGNSWLGLGSQKTRNFIVQPDVVGFCKLCGQRHCCEFEHH